MKNPQTSPHFKEYFTKTWVDTFQFSLTNFLATTFNNVRIFLLQFLCMMTNKALPKMLNFNNERVYRKLQEEEIAKLQQEITRLKQDKKVQSNKMTSYFLRI